MSRYTYKLGRETLFLDDLRQKMLLPITESYKKIIEERWLKQREIPEYLYTTKAMTEWCFYVFSNLKKIHMVSGYLVNISCIVVFPIERTLYFFPHIIHIGHIFSIGLKTYSSVCCCRFLQLYGLLLWWNFCLLFWVLYISPFAPFSNKVFEISRVFKVRYWNRTTYLHTLQHLNTHLFCSAQFLQHLKWKLYTFKSREAKLETFGVLFHKGCIK